MGGSLPKGTQGLAGKWLFERLDSSPEATVESRLAQSLDQIVAVQHLSGTDVPPGVLNFGLPRAADVPTGEPGGQAYAALVATRIRQFEPRLQDVQVVFEAGRVRVTGRYGEHGSTDFEWGQGGSVGGSDGAG